MKFVCIILLSFFSTTIVAQHTLQGILTNTENKPIANANLVLKNEIGDTIITYTTTSNSKGEYIFNNILPFRYYITITCIGFEKNTLTNINTLQQKNTVKNITLQKINKELKEVKINEVKKTIELQSDKKVFNVASNTTSAGGTTIDILKNVPGVSVDADGNVSVRGKDNITLLVDGKPSSMFGADVQTALQTIPAASIESVEVITNPGAKYEAQGMGGILNIILKKDRKPGYNGTVNIGASIPAKINGGFNINANKAKWNFFANANARIQQTWEKTESNRDDLLSTASNYSYIYNKRRPLSGFANIGAEYSIDTKNKITLSENIFNACMKGNSTTTLQNYSNENKTTSSQIRYNNYIGNPLSFTTNAKYQHLTKHPKEEINVEVNYSKTTYKRQSSFNTYLFDSTNTLTQNYTQFNPILGGNYNATFQIDYTRPIGKNARIDIGEKTYYIKFKSENKPTITYPNQTAEEESVLKNHFEYTQQVHGAYATIANTFNKTSVSAGIRAEYFIYDGFVYQLNTAVKNNYKSLFPTLAIAHKKSNTEDITFNYTRRVNRPNFHQIVPYLDVTNPQDTSMGNPNLKPEFIHATELSYSNNYGKNNTLLASIYYQYTNNLIQKYRRFNTNGTTFSQNQNLANAETYGVELINKYTINTWWDATININAFKNNIRGKNIDINASNSGWGGFGKLLSTIKFKYGYQVQVTANYFAPTTIAQGTIKSYSNVDMAIKKSFSKNRYTVTLTANDIFDKQQTLTTYNYLPKYTQDVLRKNQTRSVGINLQVRLLSKSQQNTKTTEPRKANTKKDEKKEGKNRDENLKKDDEGGGEGGNTNNEKK